MIDTAPALGRLLAWKERHAVPIRSAFSLCPDPANAFGVAPIKMVAEDVVQALAFGPIGGTPEIVTRLHPLGRASDDLKPFAKALIRWADSVNASGDLPRLWVPHESALAALELLGHRYRNNRKADDELRKMGGICYTLAREAKLAGQQVVAVAGLLLKEHVVTGQTPIKDGHLGALLAWIEPPSGMDPSEEADRRALIPASGVLVRAEDDHLEELRKVAKRDGPERRQAEQQIISLLAGAAQREWGTLIAARNAFWRLGLNAVPELDKLREASVERMGFALTRLPSAANNPDTLARELMVQEHAMQLHDDALSRGDHLVREDRRSKGRVLSAEVLAVVQPRPSCKPCTLLLLVRQPVLRVRPGTKLSTMDSRAEGRIVALRERDDSAVELEIELTKGVRRSTCPTLGSREDWTDSNAFSLFGVDQVIRQLKQAKPDVVFGTLTGTSIADGQAAGADLLALARSMRK